MRGNVWARAAIAAGCILGMVGCESGASTPRTAPLARTEPGISQQSAPAVTSERAEEPAASDQVELDRRADGARLIGTLLPVPPHADPERAVILRAIGAEPGLDGARVLDARFTRDGVVTIGTDHVLRLHRGGATTELDTGAYGPLSVAGDQVAYVRGAAPLLELARADVATGSSQQLTQQMAPCWSPTIAPDGGSIVFVSGVEGTPRLYRVERNGVPRALPQIGRTPGSPIGPRFEDGLYVFDDELGTVWVDLDAGRIVRTTGRAR